MKNGGLNDLQRSGTRKGGELRMREASSNTEQVMLQLKDIPLLPTTVGAVLQVVNEESASGSDIEHVIVRDQSLTAQTLKVANSPYYGLPRSVETVSEAVLFIGTQKIRQIASAMALGPLFKTDRSGLVDGAALWAHALATAMWTKEISSFLGQEREHYLYTAALMHDIGIVVMWQYAQDAYRNALRRAEAERLEHSVVEEQELGTTHAWIGAMLCDRWHLHPGIGQLVRGHHSESCPETAEEQLLRLADNLAGEIGAPEFGWCEPTPLPPALLARMGLGDDEVASVMDRADDVRGAIALF